MTLMSSKRANRIEKKKQKMAALFEIAKLNELDRVNKVAHVKVIEGQTVEDDDTGDSEPSPKKLRSDFELSADELKTQELVNTEVEIGPSGKPKLSGEEFIKLKLLLRETTKKMRALPRFSLREQGEGADLSVHIDQRVPLFISDIKHLIMYALVGFHAPYSPARWCMIDKYNRLLNTNVLIIDNISLYQYLSNESKFTFLSSFPHKLEILTPANYKGDCIEDITMVPLTSTQMRKYVNKFGTLEAAVTQSNDVFDIVKNVFPFDEKENSQIENTTCTDKFPRTHLLLSGWQMVEENFPLPIKGLMERKYKGYMLTKDVYKEVTPQSPMFGIDCEMCMTSAGSELTRVSIVNEKMDIFYETLVLPYNKIVNYLTKFSGITAKMMKGVTKRLEHVQEDIRKMLPADAILVGQSLNNDLHALKLMHPYIIDTSIIYNITGERHRKTKLATLSREFLDEKIQMSRAGHCSIEDSSAALKLVQLKLRKGLYFGDAVMSDVQMQVKSHPELGHPNYTTSMLKQVTKMDKTAFVVSLEETVSKYNYYTFKNVEKKNDKNIMIVSEKTNDDVVKRVTNNITKNSLNIAHLKLSKDELASFGILEKVDRWVRNVYESSAVPSLNIVLFGGQANSGNGCCFINLKTNIP